MAYKNKERLKEYRMKYNQKIKQIKKEYLDKYRLLKIFFVLWLYQKYVVEKLSTVQIGKLCDINDVTINRWLKKYGIEIRSIREAKKGCAAWNKGLKNSTIHLPIYEASFNELFSRYKNRAKEKNRKWDLTKEEFRYLTKQNCYYCGKIPSQNARKNSRFNGIYIYNGLDRLDNKIGYIKKNVVSCCGRCNFAKAGLSYDEFIAWIKKVNQFIEARG